ncbi:hypothetical protein [Lacrimispora amygdalina]|uniref:hypothetical protein n=1 Tax=Lacrimispora amygdalina TaxID=253257 RepID=UPI000BE2F961|nr:hypothetical protein [Lacrimispora amygdalina]
MNFLNDNWNKSGTLFEDFIEQIKKLSSQTEIVETNMDDFNFLNITDTGAELIAFPLNTRNLWRKTKTAFSLKNYTINKGAISAVYDETTTDETLKNGLMVFFSNKKISPAKSSDLFSKGNYMPISEKAIGTIASRIKYSGYSFLEPGLIRDLAIANKFSKPVSVYTILRTDPETKASKVFAVMSDKYMVIPQSVILDIVNKVSDEAKKDLGMTECNNWVIDHSVTRIYLDFPECGNDFSEEYSLPDEIIPGVMIETSDIGESALRIKGYFRLGGNLTYMENEFTQIHAGELKMEEIMEVLANRIFPEYRIYPEKLAKLMTIDITDSTMTKVVRVKKMTSLYRDVSKKIGLVRAIGKKREKALIDQLIVGINPEINYTAYDIAQTFLTLSSTIEVENKLVVEQISNTARNVLDYDFSDGDILVI